MPATLFQFSNYEKDQPKSEGTAAALSVMAKQMVWKNQNIPMPDDEPEVGDKCPTCTGPDNKCGVGKVGDGSVTGCVICGRCNGDGVIDKEDISSQKETVRGKKYSGFVGTIFVFTNRSCSECLRWKKEVVPELRSKNWVIVEIESELYPLPRYLVCLQDEPIEVVGYLSPALLASIMD